MKHNRGGNGRPIQFRLPKEQMAQTPGGITVPQHIAQQQTMKPGDIKCLPISWGGWPAQDNYIGAGPDEPSATPTYTAGSQRLLAAKQISVGIYVQAAMSVSRGQWCSVAMPASGFVIGAPPPQYIIPLYMSGNLLCAPLADIPAQWYGWAWCQGVKPDCLEEEKTP